MDDFRSSLDGKLQTAAGFLQAGQKKEARKVLREIISIDRYNLKAWELLQHAVYNAEEEIHCLKAILTIEPNHEAAKRRLAVLRSANTSMGTVDVHPSLPLPANPSLNHPPSQRLQKRSSSRKRRKESLYLLSFVGAFVFILCMGITGLALYRGGFIPLGLNANLTATAIYEKNASCQALIERAMQASDDYCSDTDSNKVCYGNTKIKAELSPDTNQRFSERGDIISINDLRSLSASPLSINNSEWGIAIFKVIANLPRSLPGQTVTMVVFGNTTIDNESGNLESFYFSSELGQITCEKVPFDGIMITAPDGGGTRFNINGSELTLMGDASLKANKNGRMEVSLYNGSGRIVSDGQEQYFGAGQKVSVALGGENGTQSIGAPSAPEALSQDDLNAACTLTGQYCSEGEIVPVSGEDAQQVIQAQITSTPTLFAQAPTPIPSPTLIPSNTAFVLPSWTPSAGPVTATRTRTPTRTKSLTRTNTPTGTSTRTPTGTLTNTPTRTRTATPTFTASSTATPTFTSTNTFTPTNTLIPTSTPTGPTDPICPLVSLSNQTNSPSTDFGIDITNNSGGTISISRFFMYWVKSSASQKLDKLMLNGGLLWNTSDNDSPSDIPTESGWKGGSDLTIPNATTFNFVAQFKEALASSGYEMHIVFDIGCQVSLTH